MIWNKTEKKNETKNQKRKKNCNFNKWKKIKTKHYWILNWSLIAVDNNGLLSTNHWIEYCYIGNSFINTMPYQTSVDHLRLIFFFINNSKYITKLMALHLSIIIIIQQNVRWTTLFRPGLAASLIVVQKFGSKEKQKLTNIPVKLHFFFFFQKPFRISAWFQTIWFESGFDENFDYDLLVENIRKKNKKELQFKLYWPLTIDHWAI